MWKAHVYNVTCVMLHSSSKSYIKFAELADVSVKNKEFAANIRLVSLTRV